MKSSEHNGSSSVETAAANPRLEFQPGNPGSSRPKLGLWMVVLLILFVLGVIAGVIPRWQHRQALVAQTQAMAIPTVNVISALPGKATAALTLPAEVKAVVEAPIYARASGFLKRWYVDIGAQI